MPLALDYRPRTLDELTGQTHIAYVLGELLDRWRKSELGLPPALLFSGPRGSGKTSSARIVASYLNCEALSSGINTPKWAPTGDQPTNTDDQSSNVPNLPCLSCSRCQAALGHRLDSIIEIDAASHGLVDDIRELIKIGRLVHSGMYRVFIIDEVHTATREAFSALLKQLEEPLTNVIYILVTTDPQTIPATIKSRCLHFTFVSLPQEAIAERLAHVVQEEGLQAEPEALSLLAARSKGALRDALMMLEHLAIIKDISVDKIHELWPDNTFEFASAFVETAVNSDIEKGIANIRDAFLTYRDVSLLIDSVLNRLTEEAKLAQNNQGSIPPRTILRLIKHAWDARTRARTDQLSDSILLEAMWHLYAGEISGYNIQTGSNGRGPQQTVQIESSAPTTNTDLESFLKELA